jgi:hypothetical protein
VQRLEPPDTHYLLAAIGWVELGNVAEAKVELTHVSEENREHPDVLETRWLIYASEDLWEEGLEVARSLIRIDPGRPSGWLHQSYALRRVSTGGVRQAWEALLPAFDRFPKEPTIAYNLSCYACQMQQLEAARVWFKQALVVGDKAHLRDMALEDPDLQPLWPEIPRLCDDKDKGVSPAV